MRFLFSVTDSKHTFCMGLLCQMCYASAVLHEASSTARGLAESRVMSPMWQCSYISVTAAFTFGYLIFIRCGWKMEHFLKGFILLFLLFLFLDVKVLEVRIWEKIKESWAVLWKIEWRINAQFFRSCHMRKVWGLAYF